MSKMPNRLLVRPVSGDARGADLLAEDRQCMIGQRADIGDVRIADGDVGDVLIGANVLGLADRHGDGRGMHAVRERDALVGARRRRERQHGRGNKGRPDPAAPHQRRDLDVPVRMVPVAVTLVLAFHVGLPAARSCPNSSKTSSQTFSNAPFSFSFVSAPAERAALARRYARSAPCIPCANSSTAGSPRY